MPKGVPMESERELPHDADRRLPALSVREEVVVVRLAGGVLTEDRHGAAGEKGMARLPRDVFGAFSSYRPEWELSTASCGNGTSGNRPTRTARTSPHRSPVSERNSKTSAVSGRFSRTDSIASARRDGEGTSLGLIARCAVAPSSGTFFMVRTG